MATPKDQLTPFQFGCLCFTYLSGFSTLFLHDAKVLLQDVWIGNLLAVSAAMLIMWLMSYVQRRHPGLSMTIIFERLLGKWLGRTIMIVYLFDLAGMAVMTLRALSLFYTTAILPYTSSALLILMMVLVTSYAVSLGIGTIARTVQLILPLFLIGMLFICLLIVRDVDMNPFLPQFQSRPSDIVYGTLLSFSFPFGKALGFIFLFNRVDNAKKLTVSTSVSIIFSYVYLLLATYLTFSSLGMYLMKSTTFPFFSAIQMVRLGAYLERIEISIIGIWTIFTLYETIVIHFVFVQIIGDMFRLKDARPFVLPVGLLFFAMSLRSFTGPLELGLYDYAILPFSIMFPTIIVPIVIVLLTALRERLGRSTQRAP